MKRPVGRLCLSILLIIMAISLVIPVGCRSAKTPASPVVVDLASTRVPNIDLDAYVYVRQDNPTKIPGKMIGAPADINVESVALWGVATNDQLTIGGALTLVNAGDATALRGKIPNSIWSSISDRTIYFVQDSGEAADKLKNAISKNDFKNFQDQQALAEVARLPNSAATKLAAIAVVKPSPALVKLVARYTDQKMSAMANSLIASARLQPVVTGLYSGGQIDIADLAQRLQNGTIWDIDLGMAIILTSDFPAALVSPIVNQQLGNSGFAASTVGGLTEYKGTLTSAGGKTMPVLMTVDGSSIAAAVAYKESYAQTLITSVKR
ncbi:MAG: hypothetical protein Q7R57_09200 [Dehalococcoidales bacterium]|nr:hypothetical protein [Dehalococcoidales bacterium]